MVREDLFYISIVEAALWSVQILLILAVLLFKNKSPLHEKKSLSISTCLLAIVLAWCWRLVYQFVLASGGFPFFFLDDPSRWRMAYQWSRVPYLITWDGLWLGMTSYLHGSAMRFIDDPIMASKFISAVYNLLPSVGLFVFTQTLFRDRLFSCIVVLFSAPFWLEILLSSGTMTEPPVIGLMLLGSGLLLEGLQAAQPRRRRMILTAAALSYLLASSFHYMVWLHLAAILSALLVYALWTRGKQFHFTWKSWLVFSLVSVSYCIIWVLGCWSIFGDPLYFIKHQSSLNLAILSHTAPPVRSLMLEYPEALLYTVRSFLPLALVGLFMSMRKEALEKRKVNAVLVVAGLILLILISTSVKGGTNASPYRTVIVLAALLVPISLMPVYRGLVQVFAQGQFRQNSMRGKQLLAGCLIFLFAGLWVMDNHQKIMQGRGKRLGLTGELSPDAIALGTWLRHEIRTPQYLSPENLKYPIVFWFSESAQLGDKITLHYLSGFPGQLDLRLGKHTPDLDQLNPGQILITDRPLESRQLVFLRQMGRYSLYQVGEKMEQ